MNPTEAVALCRVVKAHCPHQQIDEYTADAYHDVLGELRMIDCREAVIRLARHQPFVSPAEIWREVKNLRRDRILAFGPLEPPADLDPDDTGAYSRWMRDETKAIADGDKTPPPRELGTAPQRDITQLGVVGQVVPNA